MTTAARPNVCLSDFGPGNEWVGICHSVLAGISPLSPIVDFSHLILALAAPVWISRVTGDAEPGG